MPADVWDLRQIEAKAPDEKSVKEARKVLEKGGIRKVEPRADGRGWWAVCKGLTDTYEVSVKRGPRGGLESNCTCPSYKRPCKHALALLIYLAEHPEARPEAEAPAAPAPLDFESLLRACFAAPDDDTVRLVFADFLEENGQADRAALLRVQCELSRLARTDPRWPELTAREAELTSALRKQTGKPPAGHTAKFVRGFLRVGCNFSRIRSADGLPAGFVKLFRDGWVESLRVTWVMPGMVPLYKLVGEVDLGAAPLTSAEVSLLAAELRPDDPDTRTRVLRLPAPYSGDHPLAPPR